MRASSVAVTDKDRFSLGTNARKMERGRIHNMVERSDKIAIPIAQSEVRMFWNVSDNGGKRRIVISGSSKTRFVLFGV